MSDLREVGIEVVPIELLQHRSDHAVQLEALRGGKVVIERFADELVDECVSPRERRILRDHAGVARLGQHVQKARDAHPAGSLEHAKVELATDDGGNPQGLDRVLGQVGDATPQERADLLRNATHRIEGGAPVEQGIVRHQAYHLAEEERIPPGEHVEAGGRGTRSVPARDPREIRLDLVHAQPLERDTRGHPDQFGERLRTFVQPGLALAVGADDKDRGVGDRLANEPQHHEGRGVGRVKVIQDDYERSGLRRVDQELRDRVEQTEADGLWIDRLARAGREPLEVSAERPDRLDPGPVGGRAALLPAAAGCHAPAALTGLPGELVHQARLADARLAAQQKQEAAPRGGQVKRRAELLELRHPPDERASRRSW